MTSQDWDGLNDLLISNDFKIAAKWVESQGSRESHTDIHTFLRNWNSAVIRPRDIIYMILLTNNVWANSKTTFVPEVEILSKSSLDLVSLWLFFSLSIYKGSNYQYQDTCNVIFDIVLRKRNWWSCDLWFCAHYQALPIWSPNRSSTCATNISKHMIILGFHTKMEGREFDSCHFLLTSRSILYDKAQPLKATQLLDLYHGVNEPMALPAVAHGSKSQ